MSNVRLATRYAKSILDLSIERNEVEIVFADMEWLQSVCKSSRDFVNVLRSPIIKSDAKEKIKKAHWQLATVSLQRRCNWNSFREKSKFIFQEDCSLPFTAISCLPKLFRRGASGIVSSTRAPACAMVVSAPLPILVSAWLITFSNVKFRIHNNKRVCHSLFASACTPAHTKEEV